MAEIEIHHGHGHEGDRLAKRVGLMVGVIGVVLAVVTIAAHREHTAAVIDRTAENDEWAYYQAKKIREHTSEVGRELALALGTDAARTDAAAKRFDAMAGKFKGDAEEIQQGAHVLVSLVIIGNRKTLAEATHIVAHDPVLLREKVKLVIPHRLVGDSRVNHQQRLSLACYFVVNLRAVGLCKASLYCNHKVLYSLR